MGRVVRNEFALSNESTKETEPYENKSSTQDTEIKGEIEPVAQQDKNSCLLLTLYSLVADKCEEYQEPNHNFAVSDLAVSSLAASHSPGRSARHAHRVLDAHRIGDKNYQQEQPQDPAMRVHKSAFSDPWRQRSAEEKAAEKAAKVQLPIDAGRGRDYGTDEQIQKDKAAQSFAAVAQLTPIL